MKTDNTTKCEYSIINDKISNLRNRGELREALSVCREAIQKYPENNLYLKILGDLLFQIGEMGEASSAYISFLKKIPDNKKHFSDFARRYYRLRRDWPSYRIQEFAGQLDNLLVKKEVTSFIGTLLLDLIKTDRKKSAVYSSEGTELIDLIKSCGNFNKFTTLVKKLEEQNQSELLLILENEILHRERSIRRFKIDHYCVSVYERIGVFNYALILARELYLLKNDPVIAGTIFRICRKKKDYTIADEFVDRFPAILRNIDFNIQYELVYYYENKNNIEELITTLKRIEKSHKDSVPIQRTVRNFYLTYGLMDEAYRVDGTLEKLFSKTREERRFQEEVRESESEVGSKIKELYSELEHNKQLAAISDLTNGISHELGQPITNIRFTVQFYKRIFQEEQINPEEKKLICNVFDSILEETSRMGGLVKRLAPLTSSKNIITQFDVSAKIIQRINAERLKLQKNSISVKFEPISAFIKSDPVHFDQIINNLLLNAIDSIVEKGDRNNNRIISIKVIERKEEVVIRFGDTGVGIPLNKRGKVFDPFYTTKAPGKGEGLGLFIIWNLLKMHGGAIKIDGKCNEGACFIVTLPEHIKYTREIK